jgi:hypothetical protein
MVNNNEKHVSTFGPVHCLHLTVLFYFMDNPNLMRRKAHNAQSTFFFFWKTEDKENQI